MSKDAEVCFAQVYFGSTLLVRIAQHDFLQQSDAVFSEEQAIAKPAKEI